MNDTVFHFEWLKPHLHSALIWLKTNLMAWDSVAQLAALALIVFLAKIFSNKTGDWAAHRWQGVERRSIIRVHVPYREAFFLIYAVAFLWAAVMIAQSLGWPTRILHTVASLLLAWGVIRFTSSTIKSAFWARLIALTLWAIAALSIVDMLEPTVKLLDNAAVTVGSFRLSLLILIKSLFAFGLLIWGVSFLSDLLERAFHKSAGLTPSQKVLFHKLVKMFLFVFAFVVGLTIVGIDLTALTVFSGALGLGIGFGLQKVFSNLLSGIILLADKSVKPGDVIAIGQTYGWVNSLSARCVSVITRDGKEHLIPNENMITEQVENWSYSDSKIRIHIPVGIAYTSDIHQAKELMLQAVAEHPRILKHPAPNCLITGFGDNAVEHELRVWIADPANGIGNVKSAIYYRIWDLFKEHGIRIPLPQRDVHLKVGDMDALAEILREKKPSKG